MSVAHFDGHDNGPILYIDPNRTSAIDDIRSVVIYIFIITIFLSFLLILPGIRNSKFSTFVCIITSLVVTSIIVISLNGTTWHVGEAPISAPYKAFSRDRIQGDLGVRMGLQSVNISLRAHKYYILHATDGPMIMENTHKYSLLQQPLMMIMAPAPAATAAATSTLSSQLPERHSPDAANSWPSDATNDEKSISDQAISAAASTFIHNGHRSGVVDNALHDELQAGRTLGDSISSAAELEVEEPFASDSSHAAPSATQLTGRSDSLDSVPIISTRRIVSAPGQSDPVSNRTNIRNKRQQTFVNRKTVPSFSSSKTPFTIKRVPIDINYNERFHWIEPMQMRREYHQALERGLPYPILTVVEYLSQDDGGFSWSRQYRAAGYYTSMLLWVSASVCVLMFCLHCAAPKYGIYAMQALGVLLLLTNLNYATLVPRGDQKLVIPFEGQSLTFRFGWNFWLVLVGGKFKRPRTVSCVVPKGCVRQVD